MSDDVINAARQQGQTDARLKRRIAFTDGLCQGQVVVGTTTILGFVRSVSGIQDPHPTLVGLALSAYLDGRTEWAAT